MAVLLAKHYQESIDALIEDPIVIDLSKELIEMMMTLDLVAWEDGTPKSGFMMMANTVYKDKGGELGGHMGAVAHALISLWKGAQGK